MMTYRNNSIKPRGGEAAYSNSTFKGRGLLERGLIQKSAAFMEDGLAVPGKYVAERPKKRLELLNN